MRDELAELSTEDWPLDVLGEPIPHLEPYLHELSADEAIAGLNQLADSVLWPTAGHAHPGPAPASCASASSPQWRPVWSPGADSSQTSNFWLSSSSSSTFSVSSGPASVASSYDSASSSASPTTTVRRGRRSAGSSGKRRGDNAKAAERYRDRLKGRQCGLLEQTRREQERNARLRRELETKLSLYREFVSLLANNTSSADVHLASLGSRSVSAILSQVLDENYLDDGEERRRQVGHSDELLELRQQLSRFRLILAANAH